MESPCSKCSMRAKYDAKPNSIAGRFWRWHINFCPGWKSYFISLPVEKQNELRVKYNFNKYQK